MLDIKASHSYIVLSAAKNQERYQLTILNHVIENPKNKSERLKCTLGLVLQKKKRGFTPKNESRD